jgi:hypothetical protein
MQYARYLIEKYDGQEELSPSEKKRRTIFLNAVSDNNFSNVETEIYFLYYVQLKMTQNEALKACLNN